MPRTQLPEVRLTHQALKILRVFADNSDKELAGSDITQQTKLMSGTVYPILARLEGAGWLLSEWESVDPSKEGRPKRRLYTLTSEGKNRAAQAFREIGMEGTWAWQC